MQEKGQKVNSFTFSCSQISEISFVSTRGEKRASKDNSNNLLLHLMKYSVCVISHCDQRSSTFDIYKTYMFDACENVDT